MVLPITGPIQRSFGSPTGLYCKTQSFYKQAKPVDRPLPYLVTIRDVTKNSRQGYYPIDSEVFGTPVCPNTLSGYQWLVNTCASKLRGKASDRAEWAVNLAEYHESLVMMTKRITQLARFGNKLRKLDFVGAARVLGVGKPSRVGISKSFANNWLEYSFGWKPLIQDIYSAVDILQNPIKAVHLRAKVQNFVYRKVHTGNSSIYTDELETGQDFCKMGCTVTINNPNLYLASNLGLTNPAGVVWELIPFSFVVDWFVSVGDFLDSGNRWLGLQVTQPWTQWGRSFWYSKVDFNTFDNPKTWSSQTTGIYTQRRTSIVESAIVVKPQKLWAWERAANAASVLTQLLGRK